MTLIFALFGCGTTTLADEGCISDVTEVTDGDDAGLGVTAQDILVDYGPATVSWEAWLFPDDTDLWAEAQLAAPDAAYWAGELEIGVARGAGSTRLVDEHGPDCDNAGPRLEVPLRVTLTSADGTFAVDADGWVEAKSPRSEDHRLALDLTLAHLGGTFAPMAAQARTVIDVVGCGEVGPSWVLLGTHFNYTGLSGEIFPDCELDNGNRGVVVVSAD